MDHALEVIELVKAYPGGRRALNGVTLRVPLGQIVGLLGVNGAGKTTTIRVIAGLELSDGGHVRILGHESRGRSSDLLRRMGFVLDESMLLEWLTGRENLELVGTIHALSEETVAQRTDELLSFFDLPGTAPVSTYSTGMKKKLALGAAVIHAPEVLVLDEPFEGIDALASAEVRGMLAAMAARGTGILVTSHIMDVIDRLCDRIVIMHEGRVTCDHSAHAVKAMVARGEVPGGSAAYEALLGESADRKARARARTLSWLR